MCQVCWQKCHNFCQRFSSRLLSLMIFTIFVHSSRSMQTLRITFFSLTPLIKDLCSKTKHFFFKTPPFSEVKKASRSPFEASLNLVFQEPFTSWNNLRLSIITVWLHCFLFTFQSDAFSRFVLKKKQNSTVLGCHNHTKILHCSTLYYSCWIVLL